MGYFNHTDLLSGNSKTKDLARITHFVLTNSFSGLVRPIVASRLKNFNGGGCTGLFYVKTMGGGLSDVCPL